MELRKRLPTLYSANTQSSEREPMKDAPTPEKGSPPDNEDQIKAVVESMFASMCGGSEDGVITKDKFDEAIHNLEDTALNDPTLSLVKAPGYALSSIAMKASIRKLLEEAIQGVDAEEVTCEMFYDAALRYSEGNISLFNMFEDKKAPEADKNHDASIGTLLYYPKHTLRIIRRGVLRSVERQGAKWLWSTFTLKHFYWLVAAYLLPMMTIHAIISSVSTTLFTGGMLAMVLITIQIAIDSEKLHTRFEYLSLFQYFSKDGVQIKVKPQSSHFIHYGNFLVALLLSLVTLGFSSQSFVNNEVYVAVSLVVLFVVLLQFSLYESLLWFQLLLARSPSWIVLGLEKISFLLGVPSPQFILHFKKPLFSLPLYYGLTFDFNLLSFVQVFIHLLLMTKSLRHLESKSFLSVHGPQLIFTCWFVLCRNFVDNSDPVLLFGMFISTLSIVVMFPLSFLLFLGSPIIFFFFYGFTPPFYYSIAFVIMVIVFFILAGLVFKYLKSVWMSLSLDYVMLIVIGLAVPLIMFMSGWYASLYKPLVPLPSVSMEQYLDYCGPDNWNDKNIVQTQINCIHLKDRVFSSHGVVESVKISGVVDSMADSFKLLPTSVQSALICHIGKSTPMCGNREDMSTCVQNGCHFHDTLSYTFEVKLNFQIESIKAKLIVSHQHKDFILKLKSGSSLQFNATLVK